MTTFDVLTAGRAQAESRMCDTCKVERQSGTTLYDNGSESPTYTTLYTGKCRVQIRGTTTAQSIRDVGDQQVSVLSTEVQFPVVGSEGFEVRDRVTMLTAASDADLVGRVFRISQPASKSEATARRLQCVEVTA